MAKKKDKIMVSRVIEAYLDVECSDITNFIQMLQDTKERYKDQYTKVSIEKEYGHYEGASDNYTILGWRLETNEECDTRLVNQKEQDERNKEYKLRQLELLKKELGVE